MRKSALGLALLAVAGFARAALAAEVNPTPLLPVVKVVGEDDEKLICKRQEVIGSLIQKKRVCQTARNWARSEKHAQDELQEFTKPGAFGPNG